MMEPHWVSFDKASNVREVSIADLWSVEPVVHTRKSRDNYYVSQ